MLLPMRWILHFPRTRVARGSFALVMAIASMVIACAMWATGGLIAAARHAPANALVMAFVIQTAGVNASLDGLGKIAR